MKTFHYLPPGPEEQRGFALQFLGTLLGLALIAGLWLWTRDATLRSALIGAGLATVFKLAHSAWALEQKAQRSQNAEIGVDGEGLHLVDAKGQSQTVTWEAITECGVQGGRLAVQWNGGQGGQLVVGAREIEDGMSLVREVMQQRQGDVVSPTPSNFIPLSPR